MEFEIRASITVSDVKTADEAAAAFDLLEKHLSSGDTYDAAQHPSISIMLDEDPWEYVGNEDEQ